jgi:hypothetical protein
MKASSKVFRSAIPKDLREDGPAGKIETYWQPEAFTWYGAEISQNKSGRIPYIIYNDKGLFRISNKAALLADLKPGDGLKIGVNNAYLAIIKDVTGIPARGDAGKTKAIQFTSKEMARLLTEKGWPSRRHLICTLDEKNNMLVAKKPVDN